MPADLTSEGRPMTRITTHLSGVLVALLAAGTCVAAGAAGAAPADCTGKALNASGTGYGGTDIVGDAESWGTADPITLTFIIDTAAPSCTNATYSVTVVDSAGHSTTVSAPGNSTTSVTIVDALPVATTGTRGLDAHPYACVTLSGATAAKKQLDRAPDSGVVSICSDTGGALNFR
jgi:hypothetical protein